MTNEVPNQIDYTSRDYTSLITDLTNLVSVRTNTDWTADDPNDLGTILLESFAYMGDVMSYYIDRVANELSIDTAARRQTLINIGKLYGYRLSGPTPAEVELEFTNISDAALDIPVGTQVLAILQYGEYSEVFFETIEGAIQVAAGDTVTLLAREGKTVNTDRPDLISSTTNKPLPINLGTSLGTADQEIVLPDTEIVDNTVVVYVGQGEAFAPWEFVDSLFEYGPRATVFTTEVNEDGAVSIVFGDGINGAIPNAGQVISALYKTSVGASGNLAPNTVEEVTFIPGNILPEAISFLSVVNPSASYGGANGDDNSQIRSKIKKAISSQRRAVTLLDYENLASLVPQVGRVKAASSVYTSVNLYLQTQNDGSVTPGNISGVPTSTWNNLAQEVRDYLTPKIPAGTSLSVIPPTYVPFYVTLAVTALPSYKNADVSRKIRAAFINPGGLFSYEGVDFGQTISFSALLAKAQGVEGVVSVSASKFNTDNTSSVANPGVTLPAGSIATLPTANLIIVVTGGLS
jgi:hypothetical protein